MNCKECIYKDKKYNNNCSLLEDKDVTWDCTTTKEEYINILKDMSKHYWKLKAKAVGNKAENPYRQQIKEIREELDAL